MATNQHQRKIGERFIVVEFIKEDTVEAVPDTWITEENNVLYCFWPESKTSTKAKKRVQPDPATWRRHAIRILSSASNYLSALQKTARAEHTSNLDSEEEPPRKRGTAAVSYMDAPLDMEQCSRYDRTESLRLPQPLVLPNAPSFLTPNRCTTPLSMPSTPPGSSNSFGNLSSSYDEFGSRPYHESTPDLLKKVLKSLDAVQRNQALIQETLKEHGRLLLANIMPTGDDDSVFDFKQVEDVKKMDSANDSLKGDVAFQKMVSYLKRWKGHTIANTITRMMEKVGTLNVWVSFSFRGRGDKLQFGGSTLCNAVIKAARSCHKVDVTDIEKCIGTYLKHAPDNLSRWQKKEEARKVLMTLAAASHPTSSSEAE